MINMNKFYIWGFVLMVVLTIVSGILKFRTLMIGFEFLSVVFGLVIAYVTITDLVTWYKTQKTKKK